MKSQNGSAKITKISLYLLKFIKDAVALLWTLVYIFIMHCWFSLSWNSC